MEKKVALFYFSLYFDLAPSSGVFSLLRAMMINIIMQPSLIGH